MNLFWLVATLPQSEFTSHFTQPISIVTIGRPKDIASKITFGWASFLYTDGNKKKLIFMPEIIYDSHLKATNKLILLLKKSFNLKFAFCENSLNQCTLKSYMRTYWHSRNKIIGKILNGNLNSINLFLGGEFPINFLRRIHQPYMYVYALLNTEHAYFFLDTLIKIISYFSFFILAKKLIII